MSSKEAAANGLELARVCFAELPGHLHEDWSEAWTVFHRSCEAVARDAPELRRGLPASMAFRRVADIAARLGPELEGDRARMFFEEHLEPFRICGPEPVAAEAAFFTAYYRPEVPASVHRGGGFDEPLLARPADLITLQGGESPEGLENLSAARRRFDGKLEAYPTREEIDEGALGASAEPIAYVADAIEAFMIQVQGSARLLLRDGRKLDLTYAGRNGHPYTSIGKILIDGGEIRPEDMSLARLKQWVRANGQGLGERGRSLLHRNRSFVFFSAASPDQDAPGPIGAAGIPLTPYRSLAIDRSCWSYGLPFWINATIPWKTSTSERFDRMMVGQDTGSAIVGASRADLYFGSGARAGDLAGGIRHRGRMFVFLPRGSFP